VLVEGDDPNEPISDAVRGLLDGPLWLSRKLATKGHYPSIDVLESLSRLMPDVVGEEHQQAAFLVRTLLAAYRDHEDLISIGAYRRGSNPQVDLAIEMQEPLSLYVRQKVDERSSVEDARNLLLLFRQRAAQRLAAAKQQAKAS
jgi:flagellum-specific ATP synthase